MRKINIELMRRLSYSLVAQSGEKFSLEALNKRSRLFKMLIIVVPMLSIINSGRYAKQTGLKRQLTNDW